MSYSPAPHLLCGPHPLQPGRETLDSLLASGVTCFIDLTEPGELPSYQFSVNSKQGSAGRGQDTIHPLPNHPSLLPDLQLPVTHYPISNIQYQNLPIRDYSIPDPKTMIAILDALDSALHSGHTVYLHCHGGRGRTGTVVGCWLVRHGLTGEQALARIAELRGDHESPETEAQRGFVLGWGSGCEIKKEAG